MNILKKGIRLLRRTFEILCVIFITIYAWLAYTDFRYNQKYSLPITLVCKHEFVGCANENKDFIVLSVKDPAYRFILGEMISLIDLNNNIPERIKNSSSYLKKELVVTGILYKNKYDVSISPLYDCELFAYRFDVKKIRFK